MAAAPRVWGSRSVIGCRLMASAPVRPPRAWQVRSSPRSGAAAEDLGRVRGEQRGHAALADPGQDHHPQQAAEQRDPPDLGPPVGPTPAGPAVSPAPGGPAVGPAPGRPGQGRGPHRSGRPRRVRGGGVARVRTRLISTAAAAKLVTTS